MSGEFDGRVVVITGAGRGIGRAYAEFLAREGAKIVVNDSGGGPTGLDSCESPAAETVAAIINDGGTAVADTHDVATEAAALIDHAVDAFGRIDGLVNNAGILSTAGPEEMVDDEIARMLGVHLIGPLCAARSAWPHMRNQGYGRIVNISSAAVFGVGASPLYPTAKAAHIGMTRALAIDGTAIGIKVNCVMPMGYSRLVESQAGLADFMKVKFPPTKIAPFVAALLHEAVPCSGETFAVAGGRAARVFLGTVPGLIGFETVQDCLDGFERAVALDGWVAPDSMDEEIAYEYQNLGIDLAALGIDFQRLNTAN